MAVELTPDLSRRLAAHVQNLGWKRRAALYAKLENATTLKQAAELLGGGTTITGQMASQGTVSGQAAP